MIRRFRRQENGTACRVVKEALRQRLATGAWPGDHRGDRDALPHRLRAFPAPDSARPDRPIRDPLAHARCRDSAGSQNPRSGACRPGAEHHAEILDFLRRTAAHARYVTSVCTGSLALGAAGLLRGQRAACHWLSREALRKFGAEPTDERVTVDGNVVTGGGVTAGIDFALRVVEALHGK